MSFHWIKVSNVNILKWQISPISLTSLCNSFRALHIMIFTIHFLHECMEKTVHWLFLSQSTGKIKHNIIIVFFFFFKSNMDFYLLILVIFRRIERNACNKNSSWFFVPQKITNAFSKMWIFICILCFSIKVDTNKASKW